MISFSLPVLSWDFLSGIAAIILIDIVLAGDNALVIALAVKNLPRDRRRTGIILGASLAVLLRVALTFFVSQLLGVSYVKLIGGVLILWIAVKLLWEDDPLAELHHRPTSLLSVIWVIVVADFTMSLDNVLALAGASGGDMTLLLFGLALSIPLVMFASDALARLMDSFPVVVYLGTAVLGLVGGKMILRDPVVESFFQPSTAAQYLIQGLFAVGVVLVGKLYIKWRIPRAIPKAPKRSSIASPQREDKKERSERSDQGDVEPI
jgi:YjbE family integral membrane protein